MGLLSELPPPPEGRVGWPWTIETTRISSNDHGSWPRISIVTPSYNQASFLEETIRSVLLQNYPNLEFIVADGGSNDGSVEIIKKYDQWIARWSSGPDGGQASALNKVFPTTTGDILNWLNSDDLLLPGALFTIAELFSLDPDVDLVSGARLLRSAKTGVEQVCLPALDRWPMILAGFPLLPQETTFFKRRIWTAIGSLDTTLNYAFDLTFYSAALRESRRVVLSEATVGIMQVHTCQKSLQNNEESERNKKLARALIISRLPGVHKILARLYFTRLFALTDIVQRLFFHSAAKRKFAIGAYDWPQDRWELKTF
jgi:Glycosyl transferase family 2